MTGLEWLVINALSVLGFGDRVEVHAVNQHDLVRIDKYDAFERAAREILF